MKENDYFLNMLANPTFNPRDFVNVGLNTGNTSLEDRLTYLNTDIIRNNEMFQTEGRFDESKFNEAYELVSQSFKVFSDKTLLDKIAQDPIYSKYDMFADDDKKRSDEGTILKKVVNPLRYQTGLYSTHSVTESPFSVRENALEELVWDGATNSWLEAPNDNFGNNWKYTRVLALYDEDVFDPITGKKIHSKGEKKLNENGTYYYENLNGRDIYGRDVLSKWDTLTVDGSALNEIDFFDSDGKHKHWLGSLMKTAVQVAPILIPGVNLWYLGLRVALNTAELMSKMGKVFVGSDSPRLSAVEGYTKSLSFSQSDYTQGSAEADLKAHFWSIESLLNIAGLAFTQIAEQRWLFTYAPSLFMGKAGYDDAAKAAMTRSHLARQAKLYELLNFKSLRTKGLMDHLIRREVMASLSAEEVVLAYMKQYQTIGKYIGRAYMTGIVAADAYGEAKLAGLSDEEAAVLTLSYALLEWGLLSTDLGLWVLPELQAQKQQWKQIVRNLAKDPNRAKFDANLSPTEKVSWIRNLFNKGRDLFNATKDPAAATLKTAIGGAIAEGTEEVSEELLYDLSKTLFKLGKYYATGEKTENLHAFDDVLNRYALSFVGGAMGGGFMTITSDFKHARQIADLDKDASFKMLVHGIDQGFKEDIMKAARKINWKSEDLQAYTPMVDGVEQYKSGNAWNNLQVAFLDAFKQELDMIEDILKANGGTISDDSLMNMLTNSDKKLRLAILLQSHFMPAFLEEFNNIQTQIVSKSIELINLYKIMYPNDLKNYQPSTPEEKLAVENATKKANELKKLLKELNEKKKEFTEGKKNIEYIKRAVFLMSDELSGAFLETNFVKFAESEENTEFEKISKQRRLELEEEWKKRLQFRIKEDYERAYLQFEKLNPLAAPLLKEHFKKYFEDENIFNIIQTGLSNVTNINALDQTLLDTVVPAIIPAKLDFDEFVETANVLGLFYYNVAELMGTPSIIGEALSPQELGLTIREALFYLLEENDGEALDVLLSKIEEVEFISAPERRFLTKALEYLRPDFLENMVISNKLNKLLKKINDKPYSPINELLDKWSIETGSPQTISSLIHFLEDSSIQAYDSNELSDYTLSDVITKQIEEALIKTELLRAVILAARTDYVNETNIVSYNALINDIDSKLDLALIDKKIADVLLLDLNKVAVTLQFYKNLNSINSGLKLKENAKIDNNVTYILYDKLRTLVNSPNFPPKDWEGSDELKEVINNLSLLADSNFLRTLDLNLQQRINLKKDKIAFENAIHDFFEKNADKDLSDLINDVNFVFTSTDDSVLDKETKNISDKRFIFYLASLAVMGGSDYYKLYLLSIPDLLAPLPGQEFVTRLALAYLLNPEKFSKFVEAHNKTLEGKTVLDDITNLVMPNPLDSNVSIDFVRTMLIDGIAGSGKTTAVLKSVFAMLQNIESAKPILDDVWFVNTTFERTVEMAEQLGFPVNNEDWCKDHCFSRETMLKKIAPSYKRNVEDGKLVFDSSDLVKKNNLYHYNYGINKSSKFPSMIIVDEVGGLSLLDLLLIEEFSEEAGIVNIAMGDFDLVSLHGLADLDETYDTPSGPKLFKLDSSLYSGNFIGGWKLGTSMRSANRLIDFNTKVLRAALKDLKKDSAKTLSFKVYEDDTKLLGWSDVNAESVEVIKDKVKKWINELQNSGSKNVKIGYAHNSPDNLLHQAMMELKDLYGDIIDDNPGGASLGKELDYYVVNFQMPDFEDATDIANFWELVYTGFTRAKKGVVFDLGTNHKADIFINTSYDISEYSLGEIEIAKYQQEYKKIIENALGDDTSGTKILYKRFGEEKIMEKPKTNIKVGMLFILDGDIYTVDKITDDTITYSTYKAETDEVITITDSISEFNSKTINPVISGEHELGYQRNVHNLNIFVPIVNDNPNELNMLLESFLTHELGAAVNLSTGIAVPSANAHLRVDSINGLIKIYNKLQARPIAWNTNDPNQIDLNLDIQTKLIKALDIIKSKLLHDKFEVNSLHEAFVNSELISSNAGTTTSGMYAIDNVSVEYHYICNPVVDDVNPNIGRLKSIVEKLRKIFVPGNKNEKPNPKYITAVIKILDSTVLEIPLLMLTNPDNIIKTLPQAAQTLAAGNSSLERLKTLINALKAFTTPQPWMLNMPSIDVLELYYELYSLYQKPFDVNLNIQKLSLVMKPLGISVINTVKGKFSGFEYNGEYVSIQDYVKLTNNIVTDVLASVVDVLDSKGNVIIEAGKPFVLVSDDLDLPKSQMLNMYLNYHMDPQQGSDPHIKRVDVIPPTAPLMDYLQSFHAVMSRVRNTSIQNQVNKNIGTETTTFRLLKMIFDDYDTFKDFLSKKYTVPSTDPEAKRLNDEIRDKLLLFYDTVKAKIDELYEIYNNKSAREFINYIRGSEGLSEFLPKGIRSKSWKGFINWYFNQLVIETKDIAGKSVYDLQEAKKQIDALETIMKRNKWNGIYYHLLFKKDSSEYMGVKHLDYDYNSTAYGPVFVNGKVNSMNYAANIRFILDAFKNSKNPNNLPPSPKPKFNKNDFINTLEERIADIITFHIEEPILINQGKFSDLELLLKQTILIASDEIENRINSGSLALIGPINKLTVLSLFLDLLKGCLDPNYKVINIKDKLIILKLTDFYNESPSGVITFTLEDGTIYMYNENSNVVFEFIKGPDELVSESGEIVEDDEIDYELDGVNSEEDITEDSSDKVNSEEDPTEDSDIDCTDIVYAPF